MTNDTESNDPTAPEDSNVVSMNMSEDSDEKSNSDIVPPSAEDEIALLKDQNLRMTAEVENLRRRSEREVREAKIFANESLLKQFLPVLDSLDQALADTAETEESKSILEGFRLVQKQLNTTLENSGLTQVDSEPGAAFDPNVHQAVQKVDDDAVENESVFQVFQKGYTLHGRLVRPAMVVVKVPKKS